MRILVCDDEKDRSRDVVSRIRRAGLGEPDQLVEEDLTCELKKLFENIRACFEKPTAYRATKHAFDGADIVILDNNLAHLEVTGARLTAESIAGYIRAFTAARYIVSLNKNPDIDFDLRYLVGDYSTRADLALNSEHLENRALWTRNPRDATDGFLPWYWPNLLQAATRRRAQVDFIRKHLRRSVAKTMGFDDDAIGFLSPHAKGALCPGAESDGARNEGIPFKQLTFLDVFVAKDRSLPVLDEREKLVHAMEDGNTGIRDIVARVVAADIDFWFRRDVVGPQEPLVDIPHLLMRCPFLLGNRGDKIGQWNKAVNARTAPFGLARKLYQDHLAKTKFEHDIWVPSTCFWWPKLKADETLNELFFKAKEGDWADVVFCEDRSDFLPRSTKAGGSCPVEFPAEFEGSWGRRYIGQIDSIKYAPRSRLAL